MGKLAKESPTKVPDSKYNVVRIEDPIPVPVAEFLETSKTIGRPAPYDGYDIATAILTVDLESGDGRLFRLQKPRDMTFRLAHPIPTWL